MEILLVLLILFVGPLAGVGIYLIENWDDHRDSLLGSVVDDYIVLPIGKLWHKLFDATPTVPADEVVVPSTTVTPPTA